MSKSFRHAKNGERNAEIELKLRIMHGGGREYFTFIIKHVIHGFYFCPVLDEGIRKF